MERTTRTTLFVLLLVSMTSMALAATTATPAATAPTSATPAALPAGPVTSDSSCTTCLKCPCGCSPLAGAWVAKLDCDCFAGKESIIQTFKFVPINEGCTKFVVNAQSVTRLAKVAKFWPDACDQTEFVGTACMDEWKNIKVTAISYGVQRCVTTPKAGLLGAASTDTTTTTCPTTTDKVKFIAVLTTQITIPDDCLTCGSDQKDKDGNYTGQCKEPKELKTTVYVSFFDAAQDQDGDGFPDCDCKEAVLCVKCEACLKRVELMEPCDADTQSFVACLGACSGVTTTATGRAFVKIDKAEQDVDVVITASDLKQVKKAALQVNGADVLIVFPVPPDTKAKDCDGLLVCAELPLKNCLGPWKGKKLEDLLQALQDGKVTIVVFTDKCPNGEICGTCEDP